MELASIRPSQDYVKIVATHMPTVLDANGMAVPLAEIITLLKETFVTVQLLKYWLVEVESGSASAARMLTQIAYVN